MGIAENLQARLAAEAIAELADGEANVHGNRFWVELTRIANDHVSNPPSSKRLEIQPMTDVEAARFGKQLMPYGEFAGKRVDDVPLERLAWYADQTFTDDLRRYLKSDRVQREDRE